MKLKTKIETAQEAIRECLVAALEEKKDYLLEDLFLMYDKIKSANIKVTTRSRFTSTNNDFWKEDGFSITGNPSAASNDTISFGAAQAAHSPLFSSQGADVLSFS